MAETTGRRKKKDRVFNQLQTVIDEKQEARSNKKDVRDEEIYVDKHRQAAVTLGERDVGTDVRNKKRRER